MKDTNIEVLKKMDWNTLVHEYDLDGKRLLPWEGVNMPFGGAWCVIRKGTDSFKHNHEENEIFICISGKATIVIDGNKYDMTKGDMITIPCNSSHYVNNPFEEDFHMYSIWWDKESTTSYLKMITSDE